MKQQGFTLLEVLVSLTIFALISSSMVPSYELNLRLNYNSELKSGAFAAAQSILDQYRQMDPSVLPLSGSSPATQITIDGREYTVASTFCIETSFCSSNTRHIHLDIFYQGQEIL